MPPAFATKKTLTRARQAVKASDWVTAYESFQAVLDRFPGNKKARQGLEAIRPVAVPDLVNRGAEAQRSGMLAEAERFLGAATALAPQVTDIGLALAACQLDMGRAPAVVATADLLLKHAPGDARVLNAKGHALREMGQADAAQECLTAALGTAETDARTLNNLGILARSMGDRAAAQGYYAKALELVPDDPSVHRNMAYQTDYRQDQSHLAAMQSLVQTFKSGDAAAAPLHFALFKALDEVGQGPEAFAHLETANRLTKAAFGYDFKADAVPYALSKALFAQPLEVTPTLDTPRPIFVTGLPRSGTTLVEGILARADGVQPCGELTVVQNAVSKILRDVMGRDEKQLTAKDIAALRSALLQGLAEYSDGRPVMIDKMPLNFRWIGYICAALPEARIIHIQRDPMAVAWSLYRLSFNGLGNGYVYDPADIARFMVLHRDWMAHWRSVCPGRIFDVSYQALVQDTEATTRAMAEAVSLNWSPEWLHPEKGSHQVLTASADQVRSPIYKGSDEGWKKYESELAPLKSALTEAGVL